MRINSKLIGIIALILSIIFLYTEAEYKKELFFKEKAYDLNLQFEDKINSYKTITEILSRKITQDREILNIVNSALEDKNSMEHYSNQLFTSLFEEMKSFKSDGIDYINFYLADGRSFLKTAKYSDEFYSNCKSVKDANETHKSESAYEIDRFFDGVRYVFPLFLNDKFLGSVELSINMESIISAMHAGLDADYSVIVKKEFLESKVDNDYLREHYNTSCMGKEYYMLSNLYNLKIMNKERVKNISPELKTNLLKNKPFVISRVVDFLKSDVYIFIPLTDCKKENIGYLISKRVENQINEIYIEQFLKLISALVIFYIFNFLYRKNLKSMALLDQYKNVVDQTTLVSKTDLKGKITYVNSAFMKLSGYDEEELVGKPHSIVRHSDMPREAFEDLWKTIKAGNTWHGKVKNKKKNGSAYSVDATIFPIKNHKNEIVEYIAIRYDVTEFEELKELLTKELSNSNQSLKEKMNLLAQYEKAVESAASFTRTDTNGIITYLNETHEKVTGYRNDELIGYTHLLLRDKNVPSDFYKELWSTIKSKKNWQGVVANIAKDGSNIYLDTLIVPIIDSNKNTIEYMSIQYDISDVINMHKEIESTQREVIHKLGEIGESRSKETGNHVKRVAEYSKLLALKCGLDKKEAELLYDASPMHDIGKVAIPDSILKKPGKLDKSEWMIMKSHCDIGYSVLKGSNRSILKAAAIVAHSHHEKWDGTGYPKGLKEEEIHIYGRITAIADVFDALGSDRVYKQAWSNEKVFELFKRERGIHFDPRLIDIFFENIDMFLAIRDKFKD
ncbi:MAG: PAS domain S-box protein [Campylobacterales bacterium]|nr:PAS domain S-box protein [Campylobacterales bacterium]